MTDPWHEDPLAGWDGGEDDPLLEWDGEDGVGNHAGPYNYLRYDGSVWSVSVQAVVRDNDVAYPVGPNEWRRWRDTGMLRAMGADLLLRRASRKLLSKCIVVVTNGAPVSPETPFPEGTARREYVWCIRFRLALPALGHLAQDPCTDCASAHQMADCGATFLWPLRPHLAEQFAYQLLHDASMHDHVLPSACWPAAVWDSDLVQFGAVGIAEWRGGTCDGHARESFIVASVKASINSGEAPPFEKIKALWLSPETERAETRRSPRLCGLVPTHALSLCETLGDDLAELVVRKCTDGLLLNRKSAAMPMLLRLRRVCHTFRCAADTQMAEVTRRLCLALPNSVPPYSTCVSRYEALRVMQQLYVPAGVDVFEMLGAMRSLPAHDPPRTDHAYMLMYMRLMQKKPVGAEPPPPPPPPPPTEISMVRVCCDGEDEAGSSSAHAHGTRAAGRRKRLLIRWRVPVGYVEGLRREGWESADARELAIRGVGASQ